MNVHDKLTGLRALWYFDNRWQLIVNRLLFGDRGLMIYQKGNLEFLVDHDAGDHNGTRLCIISDIYKRFLPDMKLGGMLTVFDLGANGGGFPLMLLLSGKRFSKLVCVEMNPNTFRRLQYNVSRNVEGETVLVNGAVCRSRTKFELALGQGDISDSIYQDRAKASPKPRQKYQIEGYSFDDLFRAHFGNGVVDICKMDIEGAEYEVLASSEHTGLQNCRYLIIELHPVPADRERQFADALRATGFVELNGGDQRLPGERLYRNEKLT